MNNPKITQKYEKLIKKIKDNKLLSTPLNNKLLLKFIEAKLNGGYERIQYEKVVGHQTIIKKSRNLSRIDDYFKKDFYKLTEKEILELRDDLNNDKIMSNQTLVKWKENDKGQNKLTIKTKKTNKPLKYRTKADYVVNFKEFWEFLIEYYRVEENKELKDITRFFKVRKPTYFNEIVVKFIPREELEILISNITNKQFKAMVQLSLMSASRPCEILNVKYGENLYKNSKGEWIIHLPKIKGVSYKKFPFKIDMYEKELIPYFESLELKHGDLVFKSTETAFRKLMKEYSMKYLKKNYTPKVLRKTARMLRTNAGYTEQWINKLLGHSPNSKVQAHYTNYEGIEEDTEANRKLRNQMNPDLKTDLDKVKLETKAYKENIEEMKKEIKKQNALIEAFQLTTQIIFEGFTNEELVKVVDKHRTEKGLPSWEKQYREEYKKLKKKGLIK